MLRRLLWCTSVCRMRMLHATEPRLSQSLSLAAWSAACGPRSVEARVVFQLTKLPHAACGLPFVVASCHFLLPLPLLALKLNCFHLPAKKDDNWRSLTSAQHTHTRSCTHTHTLRQRLRLLLRAAFVGRATRGFCWLRRSSTQRSAPTGSLPVLAPCPPTRCAAKSTSLSLCLTVPLGLINCGHRSWCWADSTLR